MRKAFVSNIILTLLCFSLLFGIKFSFFPIALSKLALGYLLIVYILESSRKKEFPISKYFLPILVTLIILGIYSVIVTLLKTHNDFGFVTRISYLIYEPMLAGYLINYYIIHIQKKDVSYFILALRNAGLIQAAFTIPAYFNDGIRQLYDTILPNTGNISVENLVRVRGFSNLGGAWLSGMLCISFLCTLYEIECYKNRLLNVLTMILLLFAMIITGRTGLMISILALAVYTIRWLFIGKITKTFGYITVTLSIGTVFLVQTYPEILDSVSDQTIEWAFEAINNDGGSIGTTRSGDNLKEMLYLPTPATNLLFGSGLYIKGTYHNPRSDSGYMKTLLAIGLFAGFLFYCIYGFISLKTIKNYYINNSSLFFLVGFLLAVAFLVEIKEPYLQTLGYTFVIFSLFFISNSERKEYMLQSSNSD